MSDQAACTHYHELTGASPGERVSPDAPLLWAVVDALDAIEWLAYPNGQSVHLAEGTNLRYEQRDYDAAWRHQGWDRFVVLDGPHAGRCVSVEVPMPASPVHGSLRPTAATVGKA